MYPIRFFVIAGFIILSILFLVGKLSGQYSNAQIDSLHLVSNELRKSGEFEKAALVYEQLLRSAQKNRYSEAIARSYLRIANLHTVRGHYTIANHYLDSARPFIEEIRAPWYEATLYMEIGKNCYFLNLMERSFQNLQKALLLASHIEADSSRRERVAHVYEYLSLAYEKVNQADSSFIQVKKAFGINPTPVMASRISRFYLRQYNNVDSARKYLSVAKSMIATGRYNVHSQSMVLRMEGIFDFEQGRVAQAVANYQKSIEISRKLGIKSDEMITNRLLSAAYKAMNDEKGIASSLERYTLLSDSLTTEGRMAAEAAVKIWLLEVKKSGDAALTKTYVLVVLLSLFTMAVLYYIVRRFRRRLAQRDSQLAQKNDVIKQGTKIQQALSLRINASFNELIELAKNNDPGFYVRFNEVYPNLQISLLAMVPGLRVSELTLSAYIFLNFSAKDIAEYTFTSPRTVQTRKYNLRKKLGLQPSEDLYVWIKNLPASSSVS